MIESNKFEKYFPSEIIGQRKRIDNTIYTFDIETSSYLLLNNKIIPASKYLDLTKDEQKECEFNSSMYIWIFGINENVYYGRTWFEFKMFLDKLDFYNNNKKIVFIHNLSYEFQYLKSQFKFKNVLARKSHKVMRCEFEDYNIELRCSYFMTNSKLEYLPKIFCLPVEKKVGDLDYNKIRNSLTTLSKKELSYCEYDCLVIYEYIKKELETYNSVDNIPITSTGHVRRELKELVSKDYNYKCKVRKAINIEPHIFNLLQQAFAGRIYSLKLDLYRYYIKKYY